MYIYIYIYKFIYANNDSYTLNTSLYFRALQFYIYLITK